MKEIVIRIGKDGKVNVSVSGVKGSSCKDITHSLENALGAGKSTEPTEEFYEEVVDDEHDQDHA